MMTQKKNTLRICNLTGGFECSLFNYGTIRDTIGHADYTFESGIYVVEGECFAGGWALSTILTGRCSDYDGQILINDVEVNADSLRKSYSCMVGDETELRKYGFIHMSIKEQMEYGIKNGKSFCNDFQKVKDLFGVTSERMNRKMALVGIERWRDSLAIGYANGKIIYCLPWMNSKNFKMMTCWEKCLPVLLSVGAIIIIPSTSKSIMSDLPFDFTSVRLEDMYRNDDGFSMN